MRNCKSVTPVAALSLAPVVLAQPCEPGWTEGFPIRPGINGEVRAITMFDDGSGPALYAGGHFTLAGGNTARGIARWTGDAWVEAGGGVQPVTATMGYAVDGVYSLSVLGERTGPGLCVAGLFNTAGGIAAKNIARWDGNTWSKFGPGLGQTVRATTVFDDGTGAALYAAGLFTHSGETLIRGIAKWNGSTWSEVGGGLGGSYAAGYSLAVLDTGSGPRLYVGGRFQMESGANIACWDGQHWTSPGEGVHGSSPLVMKMIMFDHGAGPQLTIGGSFSLTPGAVQRPRVARWTGSQWAQVGSDLSDASFDYVNSLVALPGASGPVLHIGGWFSGATWLNEVNYVARLSNGDWQGLGGGMSGAQVTLGHIRSMCAADEPAGPVIYAAGAFSVAGDALADRVAKWDGQRWHGLEHGRGLHSAEFVGTLASQGATACTFDDGSGERVFVGGRFVAAGDRVCNSIAAWDGQSWHQLGPGVQKGGAPGDVLALHPFDDGSGRALYASGEFDEAGGGPAFSIARWDGTHWSALGGSGIARDDGGGDIPRGTATPSGPLTMAPASRSTSAAASTSQVHSRPEASRAGMAPRGHPSESAKASPRPTRSTP